MITFDMLTLKAFIKEEKDFLTGAVISKVKQPSRREFILTLRNNGTSRDLYINITPQLYHLCFTSKINILKRNIEIPQKPPMFCMQLRKYIENSRIKKLNQPNNERILELFIETYSEAGDKIYLCLAIELMGKHSNVILYNYDTNIIIGCAHNVGSEKSREREVYGGIPYIYPPKQIKSDITNFNGEIDYNKLSSDFYGFSNAFAKLCYRKSLKELQNYISLDKLTPAITKNFKVYSLYSELLENPQTYNSVSEMLDEYYTYYTELEIFKTRKSNFTSIIEQKLKRVQKSIDAMEKQIFSEKDCDSYRLYGDLIMANLYNLKDYSEEIELYDYENDANIKISINPLKTIKENANIFYKKYNKGKTSRQKLTQLIGEAKEKSMYFEQILYSIENAQDLSELEEIAPEVDETRPAKKNSEKPKVDKIELENGDRIFIGKNNRQNDYIVSKLAQEDDLWFHVHNCAGSHILLKSQNPTEELILKCAKLAKEYSQAKEASKAGVIYTKRKYLRKPPAAALGYVTYKNEKEIIV